ncbi:MAG: dTDP-glucose 4,6-dehydratase [Candidatus Omnitrophota bacterium]
MREKLCKTLVAGGAGFIGSAFVRLLINRDCPRSRLSTKAGKGTVPNIVIVDKLTYAGDLGRLEEVRGKFNFYKADICNQKAMELIFKKEKPKIVINFAAETHVDRSIKDAAAFIKTNIEGVRVLLDTCRKYGIKKFIQISSDEIYGEVTRGKFSENSPLSPNNPYAASKAAADLLIKSYIRTYNFPAIIIRPCNNYGPWQYPEKLIPLCVLMVLKGRRTPVYGKGLNVREWLYVEDCASGILAILRKGKLGEAYNLGSGEVSRNIDTVKLLLKQLGVPANRFKFVPDRPGHDIRYCLDWQKAKKAIAWKPKTSLRLGIKLTADWYLKNKGWLLLSKNNDSALNK